MKRARISLFVSAILVSALLESGPAVANDSTGGLSVSTWTCFRPDPAGLSTFAEMAIGNLQVDTPKQTLKGKNTTLTFTNFHFSNMKGLWSKLTLAVSYNSVRYGTKVMTINSDVKTTPVKFSVSLPSKYLPKAEFIINLADGSNRNSLLNALCIPTSTFNSHLPVNASSSLEQLNRVSVLASKFIAGSGSAPVPSNLVIHIDPTIADTLWLKNSVATIASATQLVSAFGLSLEGKLNLYISWGPAFRNLYIPDSCKYNAGGGSCGNGDIWADLQWFAGGSSDISNADSIPDALSRLSIAANIPHELGHEAQQSAAKSVGNPNFWMIQPAWLREGTAEFFKLVAYSKATSTSYLDLRNLYLQGTGNTCLSVSLTELTGQGSYSSSCEYTKGLIATEYLIAKTGNMDALFITEKIPGEDFAAVFEKAYGISLAQFSAEADDYFAKAVAAVVKK